MRVLVADQEPEMLEAIARAFEVDVATSKATCIDLLRANPFDVIVACERLSDGSGLELLSHVGQRWPNVVRILAIEPERRAMLRGRLAPFKLFETLSYPIEEDKLEAALGRAAEAIAEREAQEAEAQADTPAHAEVPTASAPTPERSSSGSGAISARPRQESVPASKAPSPSARDSSAFSAPPASSAPALGARPRAGVRPADGFGSTGVGSSTGGSGSTARPGSATNAGSTARPGSTAVAGTTGWPGSTANAGSTGRTGSATAGAASGSGTGGRGAPGVPPQRIPTAQPAPRQTTSVPSPVGSPGRVLGAGESVARPGAQGLAPNGKQVSRGLDYPPLPRKGSKIVPLGSPAGADYKILPHDYQDQSLPGGTLRNQREPERQQPSLQEKAAALAKDTMAAVSAVVRYIKPEEPTRTPPKTPAGKKR
jgi:DNA-binding NarL/FixJ family response regulator